MTIATIVATVAATDATATAQRSSPHATNAASAPIPPPPPLSPPPPPPPPRLASARDPCREADSTVTVAAGVYDGGTLAASSGPATSVTCSAGEWADVQILPAITMQARPRSAPARAAARRAHSWVCWWNLLVGLCSAASLGARRGVRRAPNPPGLLAAGRPGLLHRAPPGRGHLGDGARRRRPLRRHPREVLLRDAVEPLLALGSPSDFGRLRAASNRGERSWAVSVLSSRLPHSYG